MKVLLLTQWFDPEPTLKGLVFAKELQKRGHEVSVLTGFPNYPGGKIYDGYKLKLYQKELIDGIHVLRVPLYPSHDKSVIKRILNYISFAFMAMIFGIFFIKKHDVLYTYHPPLTVGVAAIFIKFFRRVPIVYDIQDMWPDTLKATGMMNNEKILKVIDIACGWVYKFVDHIVVLSPGFKELLIQRNVPTEKISIIYNWCDEDKLQESTPIKAEYRNAMTDKFNIVFAGNIGKAQSLDCVIDVAAYFDQKEDNNRIQFVFVGAGIDVDRLKERCKQENINNIVFFPYMPMSEVGGVLSEADLLLVHLKKDKLFEVTIPSKTQAYLLMGKPILMGVDGDAADIIVQANAGKVMLPENVESMKEAILDLSQLGEQELRQLGLNGKQFYQDKMSIQVGVNAFIDIFDKTKA